MSATPKKKKPVKRAVPYAEVAAALLSLPATREGFEGLTATLIDAATGGTLRLLASGDQLGVDGIADPVGPGPRRAMQSKSYKASTSLDRNGLVGEMASAHEAWPGIDCWILVSTKSLQGTAARTVRNFAETLGWGFVALDWSEIAPGFPRLATLCAAYPDHASAWGEMAAVRASLDAIAAAPGFSAARDKVLAELRATDTGFVAARENAVSDLNRLFADAEAARAIVGPSPALLVSAPPVPRIALRASVATWWSTDSQAAVLLGLEGMGKTWGALDALRALALAEHGPLPIVIGAAAAVLAANGLDAVIAALGRIGEEAGLRVADPPRFWRRRLTLWGEGAGEAGQPRLLVLVDGLDEIAPFDWPAWLAPLRVAERTGLIRLILTCRDDEWRHRVAPGLAPAPSVLPVGRFSTAERDAYLRSRDVDPGLVSAVVLAAALHPRTAFHLTRLADEIGDLTRITREQLLLRDFQNLCLVKGGPATPAVFEGLVREMATQAQAAALRQQAYSVTSGTVLDTAAELSGDTRDRMRRVLGDLVSGAWLERDADDPTRFGFTDRGLPDAVGLALARLIRRLDVPAALAEIDRFLEPWGADDLVEKVLRTCATALIVDPQVPDALCTAVLERWHAHPMHGNGGQDFWRRLHIFRPTIFLDVCERQALRGDWLLAWGVACLWEDHPRMRLMIAARLHAWLTPIPVPEVQSASRPQDSDTLNRTRARQLRRLRALDRRLPGVWEARIGRPASEVPEGLGRLAARVIGYLPRLPFVSILRDWALHCAAAGRQIHVHEVEALLRDDHAEDAEAVFVAVRAVAEALASEGRDVARTAAALLLRCAGDPDDAARAEAWLPAAPARVRRYAIERMSDDAGPVLVRGHDRMLRPLQLIEALTGEVGDPAVTLSEPLADALQAAVDTLVPADMVELFSQDGRPATVLLRWHPERFFTLWRAYLLNQPVPEDDHDRADYRRIAQGALPILTEAERAALAARLEASAAPDGTGRGAATALRMTHAPLADQIALLIVTPLAQWPAAYRYLLDPPASDEREQLIAQLDFTAEPDLLRRNLILAVALIERFGQIMVSRDWSGAFTLADPDAQRDALRIAHYAGGEAAAEAFAPLGQNSANAANPVLGFEISGLLSNLGDAALRPNLARLDAETLSHVYLGRPALCDEVLPLWRAWMVDRIAVPRRSHGFGADRAYYVDRDEAYAAYVVAEPDQATALLRGAWDDAKTRQNIVFDHGGGPTWPLLQALAPSHPDLVKEIWRGVAGEGGVMWATDDQAFPAKLPAGTMFDDVRAEMLDRPTKDGRLFDMVRALERGGHLDFLIGWIERGLAAVLPATRARVITVAGFLDASDAAVALWDGPLAARPAAGWLADVYDVSAKWFSCARVARHWYLVMREATTEPEALRAFWLLNRVADTRMWLFSRQEPYKVPHDSFRAQWLDFFRDGVKAAREAPAKEIAQSYFHGPSLGDVIDAH
ncbi:hypothetical protein [Sphingomonas abietis]|uniref:NACHT domain-containing protein n=1 Tax=Sphingomonas abietis TaxID=3012344 RepID=A0ABY7NS42_9SPHN|nr:hypothetical protein [Sphingomonas abietis]WBO24323.1 hypothetical protein PBT88_09590 [Sphingomonas abietis]